MSANSVTVLIPVHNMGRHLFRAVGSAFWQLAPDDDIIVVDDASDDLPDLRPFEPFQPRISWLRNQTCRGCAFSRNRAIQQSQCEWVKFLDADDVLAPFALDAVRQELPPEIQVVTGGCHRMADGQYLDYLNGAEESLKAIFYVNPMLPSATFVRRQALIDVGMFDERIDFEEDWDMWLKLHERFGPDCFLNVPQPICYYWMDDDERRQKKARTKMINSVPVRQYFRQRYGATPLD